MTTKTDRSSPWLTGFIADLPTPFDCDDNIDWRAFETLCDHQIKAGAAAIVVGETTGEASTLRPEEHDAIIRSAVAISRSRIAVIAGAGSNSTSQAIEFTMRAETCGADAVMSVVPYYNKPTQAGIVAHFQAIAALTALPIILHDAPARTMRELSDDALRRLADSVQFAGIRDDWGQLARLMRLKPMLPPHFRMLSGDDSTALGYFLSGGDGCVSVLSNIAPELCTRMYECCRSGNLRGAQHLADRLTAVTAALSVDATPASLKYALGLLGVMAPGVRLPLAEPDEPSKILIARAIAALCESDQRRVAGLGG